MFLQQQGATVWSSLLIIKPLVLSAVSNIVLLFFATLPSYHHSSFLFLFSFFNQKVSNTLQVGLPSFFFFSSHLFLKLIASKPEKKKKMNTLSSLYMFRSNPLFINVTFSFAACVARTSASKVSVFHPLQHQIWWYPNLLFF